MIFDFIHQNDPFCIIKNQNQVHFSKPRFFISIYNEKWSAADVLGQVERNLGRSADSTHHCRVRFQWNLHVGYAVWRHGRVHKEGDRVCLFSRLLSGLRICSTLLQSGVVFRVVPFVAIAVCKYLAIGQRHQVNFVAYLGEFFELTYRVG